MLEEYKDDPRVQAIRREFPDDPIEEIKAFVALYWDEDETEHANIFGSYASERGNLSLGD